MLLRKPKVGVRVYRTKGDAGGVGAGGSGGTTYCKALRSVGANDGPGIKIFDVGTENADVVSHKKATMQIMKKRYGGMDDFDAFVVVVVSAFSVDSSNTRGSRFPERLMHRKHEGPW